MSLECVNKSPAIDFCQNKINLYKNYFFFLSHLWPQSYMIIHFWIIMKTYHIIKFTFHFLSSSLSKTHFLTLDHVFPGIQIDRFLSLRGKQIFRDWKGIKKTLTSQTTLFIIITEPFKACYFLKKGFKSSVIPFKCSTSNILPGFALSLR